MSNQGYENQLSWCKEAEQFLHQLESELNRLQLDYATKINELRSNQYLNDYLPKLQQAADIFAQEAKMTCDHIDFAHIGYIVLISKSIQVAIDAAEANNRQTPAQIGDKVSGKVGDILYGKR